MEKNNAIFSCCSSNSITKDIQGARFSLFPMSDNYIDIILSSIKKVNTCNIHSQTDYTSTVYRGTDIHVIDALKAAFIYSYRDKIHMSMQVTFSRGCPGDKAVDYKLCHEPLKVNESDICDIHFPVLVKFSLYPLGKEDYMEDIKSVINDGIEMNVYHGSGHYVSFLKGDVQDIFKYFEKIVLDCSNTIKHYVIEATFLVNLPEEV